MIDRLLELVSAKALLGALAAALAALALTGWLYTGALERIGAARAATEAAADASDANLASFKGCAADLTRITGQLAEAGTKLAASEARLIERDRAYSQLSQQLRGERARQHATDPSYAAWADGPVPAGVFERLRAASRGPGGASALSGPDAGPAPGALDAGSAGGRDP